MMCSKQTTWNDQKKTKTLLAVVFVVVLTGVVDVCEGRGW